ncbi:uncharacterized protein LOC142179037 [Nicotiana tabacum]|uniref:Uncharacterized protein LOC142179037 n=1 Tax=Nicotiana tabacum TaxID=4097 RepID=A0AC58U633_TOBAC
MAVVKEKRCDYRMETVLMLHIGSTQFSADTKLENDLYSGRVKGIGKETGELYLLKGKGTEQKTAHVSSLEKNKDSGELWHRRLGHPSLPVMQHVSFLHNKVDNTLWMTILEQLGFLMQLKSEIIIFLKQFFCMVQTQFGTCVKVVRTDNGREFFNHQWTAFLQTHGIIHQSSCVHTPQQNGADERKHRHILDTARALKFQAGIPRKFWGESLQTAVYLINRLPTRALGGKSPFELLMEDKFGPRAREAVLMGDVIFRKSIFPFITAQQQQPGEHADLSISISQEPNQADAIFDADAVSDAAGNEGIADQEAASGDADPAILEQDAPAELPMAPMRTTDPTFTVLTRKSTRTKHPPIWMQDYLVASKKDSHCPYPISNFLSYDNVTQRYKDYIMAFSTITEPHSFNEAVKDE